MNMNMMNPQLLDDIKSEITKSLKSINYSQWERQPKDTSETKQPKSRPLTSSKLKSASSVDKKSSSNNKTSSTCNHHKSDSNNEKRVFKTRKQMQEEENRKNILKIKIKFVTEYLETMKQREVELFESNRQLLLSIEKKEKTSNIEVDSILRKYERYQNVKSTIKKKTFGRNTRKTIRIGNVKKGYESRN